MVSDKRLKRASQHEAALQWRGFQIRHVALASNSFRQAKFVSSEAPNA
jgi:hypothetical protein